MGGPTGEIHLAPDATSTTGFGEKIQEMVYVPDGQLEAWDKTNKALVGFWLGFATNVPRVAGDAEAGDGMRLRWSCSCLPSRSGTAPTRLSLDQKEEHTSQICQSPSLLLRHSTSPRLIIRSRDPSEQRYELYPRSPATRRWDVVVRRKGRLA
jgi:hypothetical protein